ncbi:MAG TPA: hypothetical protein VKN76_03425, partial [Kiloniellaceae bacterium]|nr:hypothetical protein [Kiloniellaceae bacterium]
RRNGAGIDTRPLLSTLWTLSPLKRFGTFQTPDPRPGHGKGGCAFPAHAAPPFLAAPRKPVCPLAPCLERCFFAGKNAGLYETCFFFFEVCAP